jgi:hypothetical protein
MRHDEEVARRHRLAQQILDEAERCGLRVWQQYQVAHVARVRNGDILPAPREWQRLVAAMSYDIASLLDPEADGVVRSSGPPPAVVCCINPRSGTEGMPIIGLI